MVHGKYITIEAARVWSLLPRRLSLDFKWIFVKWSLKFEGSNILVFILSENPVFDEGLTL